MVNIGTTGVNSSITGGCGSDVSAGGVCSGYTSGGGPHASPAKAQSCWLSSIHVERLTLELKEAAGIDCLSSAMQAPAVAMDPAESPAKQARVERSILQLSKFLRQRPTIPELSDGDVHVDSGVRFPAKHCAFIGCTWCGETDAELTAHLSCAHESAFREADHIGFSNEFTTLFSTVTPQEHPHYHLELCPDCGSCEGKPRQWSCNHCRFSDSVYAVVEKHELTCNRQMTTRDRQRQLLDGEKGAFTRVWTGFYNAAISHIERNKMPSVGYSVDRRSSEAFSERYNDENLCAPMCFICARIFSHDAMDATCGIQKRKCFDGTKFAGMDAKQTSKLIGLQQYLDEYGQIPGRSNGDPGTPIARSAFTDWCASVEFTGASGPVEVLCCPEDVHCTNHSSNLSGATSICPNCEVYICDECHEATSAARPRRPDLALSNDLWFGYLPKMIYDDNVTYMELLCASICHPTMMSFQVNCYGWNLRKTKVHMQETRVGARGNMTAFQVPWENVFEEMVKLREQSNVQLPRVGSDLLQLVQVVLQLDAKAGEKPTQQERRELLASATVRREVVIKLVSTMKDLGHRDYSSVDMSEVIERAQLLPEADVPPEVLSVLNVNESAGPASTGKVSVPADALTRLRRHCGSPVCDVDGPGCNKCGIPDALRCKRLAGADAQTADRGQVDLNVQLSSAIANVHEQLTNSTDTIEGSSTALMKLSMGSARNQFESTFFLTAYAFLFPYSVGAPDLRYQQRDRRTGNRVDFSDQWCPTLLTRAEGQFRRDLSLPFALWNLTFRTVINIGHNLYHIKKAARDGSNYTADDFASAAENISACLVGTYKTPSNITLRVNGDIRRLRNASQVTPPLSSLAKSMLDSFHATCKRIEGTQETRQMMRHELNAYRVALGRMVMVTISPNERHNTLMIRLSRVRESDPIGGASKVWGAIDKPKLVESEEVGEVAIEMLLDSVPSVDDRRQILARDPLASVYGFRLLCKIMMSTLFGVRVCSKCPDCNFKEGGCVDAFGSVALSEGGGFGRADGYYGSIENQKEDSQHLHCMWALQCMYQFKSLHEIAGMLRHNCSVIKASLAKGRWVRIAAALTRNCSTAEAPGVNRPECYPATGVSELSAYNLLAECYHFKQHVCSESYTSEDEFNVWRDKLEEDAPDYATSARLSVRAQCLKRNKDAGHVLCSDLGSVEADGERWKGQYNAVVQQIQMRVNHHVHRLTEDNVRMPMPYCKSKANPTECTKGFPRPLIAFDPRVEGGSAMCPGMAKTFNVKATGSRSLLGTIATPRSNQWLNGSHKLLLANLPFNSDVLVPYRLPLMAETHTKSKKLCQLDTCLRMPMGQVIRTLEQSMRDQIGYITDYVTKRQPVATSEVDAFIRGHRKLQEQLHGKALSVAAVRHTQRLLSDVLGRGTIRKAVECTNLVVCRKKHDVTAAESLKSHLLVPFPCGDYMRFQSQNCGVEVLNDDEYDGMEIDRRNPVAKSLLSKVKVPGQYGHRGGDVDVAYLTPYEFHTQWAVERVSYPSDSRGYSAKCVTIGDVVVHECSLQKYHAMLTKAGATKLGGKQALEAGVDYIVRAESGVTRDRRYRPTHTHDCNAH